MKHLLLVPLLMLLGAAPAEQPGGTVVERVLPNAAEVPANLLKFYVFFSAPVRQTDRIFDQMHLRGEDGKEVYDPWRRFHQWSDDGKRLTLWIHPGRIKQGVNLREEFGPVLAPGHKYKLVIDRTIEDLPGNELARPFEREFTATAELHERVDMNRWSLRAVVGSHVLRFTTDRPMDGLLMQRFLRVRDAVGNEVKGRLIFGAQTCYEFHAEQPWRAETYTLESHELLEDLAGNTPVRVFDTDLTKPEASPAVLHVAFTPLASPVSEAPSK
jgi:hypothetical protein